MTVILEIDEPQRQTFVEFLKAIPYVTVVSEKPADDDADWKQETARNFLAGYADSDSIYDRL
jgi:ABC-type sugar transport system substrate-binding protein